STRRWPTSATGLDGPLVGLDAQGRGRLAEVGHRRVDVGERELAVDDGQVDVPGVLEDPAQVRGGVGPALAGRAGPVPATAGDDQGDRAAGERLVAAARAQPRRGEQQVDPGLDVLRDPEVVQGYRDHGGVGADELVGQLRGEGEGRT